MVRCPLCGWYHKSTGAQSASREKKMSGKHGKEETRRKKGKEYALSLFSFMHWQCQGEREATEAEVTRDAFLMWQS